MITEDIRRNKKAYRIMVDISKMTRNGAFKAYGERASELQACIYIDFYHLLRENCMGSEDF